MHKLLASALLLTLLLLSLSPQSSGITETTTFRMDDAPLETVGYLFEWFEIKSRNEAGQHFVRYGLQADIVVEFNNTASNITCAKNKLFYLVSLDSTNLFGFPNKEYCFQSGVTYSTVSRVLNTYLEIDTYSSLNKSRDLILYSYYEKYTVIGSLEKQPGSDLVLNLNRTASLSLSSDLSVRVVDVLERGLAPLNYYHTIVISGSVQLHNPTNETVSVWFPNGDASEAGINFFHKNFLNFPFSEGGPNRQRNTKTVTYEPGQTQTRPMAHILTYESDTELSYLNFTDPIDAIVNGNYEEGSSITLHSNTNFTYERTEVNPVFDNMLLNSWVVPSHVDSTQISRSEYIDHTITHNIQESTNLAMIGLGSSWTILAVVCLSLGGTRKKLKTNI